MRTLPIALAATLAACRPPVTYGQFITVLHLPHGPNLSDSTVIDS